MADGIEIWADMVPRPLSIEVYLSVRSAFKGVPYRRCYLSIESALLGMPNLLLCLHKTPIYSPCAKMM